MPAHVTPDYAWKPLRYKRDEKGRQRWMDPATGCVIFKDPEENLTRRAKLWEECANNPVLQAGTWKLCRDSFLYWVNNFGYTFVQVEHTHKGRRGVSGSNDRPFITWPVQDDAAAELIESTGLTGKTATGALIDKSREMGATWLMLAIILWLFLFHRNTSMLMCADREEAVDYSGRPDGLVTAGTANKDTLFGKLDYMLAFLPPWMTVGVSRVYMHYTNARTGSRIDGSSTREDLGRGGRRFLVFVDEASAIRQLKQIDKSIADTTACPWYNSTPKGAHYFSELRTGGTMPVIVLGWWDHPHKGREGPKGEPGRYIAFDQDKGEEVITGWWRELEKKRRKSIQDVAENIDIDHMGAGRVVFNLGVLNRHLATYCYPAQVHMRLRHRFDGERRDISIRKRKLADIIMEEIPPDEDAVQGVLQWWGPLVDGRPPQDRLYVLAADVSGGNGASNSIVTIRDVNTGEKVGTYVDANIPPDGLAMVMAQLGLWVGGERGYGYLIWEANGPGNRVGRVLVERYAYPWLHIMEVSTKKRRRKEEAKRLGWWNSPQSVYDAALQLDAEYTSGRFINHDRAAVQEAMKWVRYETGIIGPGPLEFETPEARKTHGDRVIADMLAAVGAKKCIGTMPRSPKPPVDSPAAELGTLDGNDWRGDAIDDLIAQQEDQYQ